MPAKVGLPVIRTVVGPVASVAATIIGAGMVLAVVFVMMLSLLVLLMLTWRVVGPIAGLADTDSADHECSRRSEKGDDA